MSADNIVRERSSSISEIEIARGNLADSAMYSRRSVSSLASSSFGGRYYEDDIPAFEDIDQVYLTYF